METQSSKQSGGWGTSLLHRYKTDLFFRTICHITVLQVLLVGALLIIFWFSLRYLENGLVSTMVEIVSLMLSGNSEGGDLSLSLKEVTRERFQIAAVILSAVTLCFGFVMTYVALTPTRRSLERKKRFVSNVAHELRTPLSIIRTNTDVALYENDMSPELRETLESNIVELNRITDIMDNLLTLSSVMCSGNASQMEFEKIELNTVVESALSSLKKIAEEAAVTVEFQPSVRAFVLGKAVALEQIVFNLVKNAIENSPPKSGMTISLDQNGKGYVDLIVTDEGEGISREDLFKIFEPFYRSGKARLRSGSGLGLTIVAEIVKMHHGRVTVNSKEDLGTTVIVTLPEDSSIALKDASRATRGVETSNEVYVDFSKNSSLKRIDEN